MEQTCCPEQSTLETIEESIEIVESEEEFLLNKQSRSEQRMEVCKQCPELRALNNCRQCGCFMNIKTRIYSAICPLGKW
jgi:hypothetical protein